MRRFELAEDAGGGWSLVVQLEARTADGSPELRLTRELIRAGCLPDGFDWETEPGRGDNAGRPTFTRRLTPAQAAALTFAKLETGREAAQAVLRAALAEGLRLAGFRRALAASDDK